MTHTLPPLENRKKWSVEEFDHLIDLGAFDDRHFELINGEITEKMAQNEPHQNALILMQYKLLEIFGRGFLVRVQLPMALEESKPEPDLCIVRGIPQGRIEIPTTALLAVEIADTTLTGDRDVKSHLYARALVPEYWIVDLNARQIEVRRDPRADESAPLGWTYGALVTLDATDSIASLARPDVSFLVADVLP